MPTRDDGDRSMSWREARNRYGLRVDQTYAEITRVLGEFVRPASILDIGCGNGNWYTWIRRAVGYAPHYTGVDASSLAIQSLQSRIQTDDNAEGYVARAEALPLGDDLFSWVGLHFMLHHASNIEATLREAWRVTSPGGLMAAATGSYDGLGQLDALGREVARHIGVSWITGSYLDRFTLENGAQYFPSPPTLFRWAAGYKFPDSAAALALLDSTVLSTRLGEDYQDVRIRHRVLRLMRERIDATIASNGCFQVHSEQGVFVLVKSRSTVRRGSVPSTGVILPVAVDWSSTTPAATPTRSLMPVPTSPWTRD